MSSTNRGVDRHKTDYYITPHQAIRDFLSAWLYDLKQQPDYNNVAERPDRTRWFDPCAGGDVDNPMSYPAVLEEEFAPAVLATMDIREDSKAETIMDYLTYQKQEGDKYDVIITNPPFYLAKEIIEKALNDVEDDGYVVMLLRLNFLGSQARFDFFQDNMPESIYVHHKRIGFTEDGKTDSIEYAHMVWRKGRKENTSTLSII